MARTVKNAVLSFGLVTVPVGVVSTRSTSKETSFQRLHDKCSSPVEVRTPTTELSKVPEPSTTGVTTVVWCPTCDIEAGETVRGYEYAKGQFVVITDEEFEEVSAERETSIVIDKFVKLSEIKQVMVEKSYWLSPNAQDVLAHPYGLLYQCLAEMKLGGIGTQTLWGKEHPCAIVPNQDYIGGGVLQMLTLFLNEDLVEPDFGAPTVSREDKKMAKAIIENKMGDFIPAKDLVSDSRNRMQDLIAAKIEGREFVASKGKKIGTLDPSAALKKEYERIVKSKGKKEKARA